MECPKCKNKITEDMLVCPYCKKVLKLACPKCKTINKSNTCKKCGFVIISKCRQCGKINQTINGKCSKCGFSTYTSVAINSSNIDEFACLTIEFPNLAEIKSVLGSTKLTDKFNKNLNGLITNYANSIGITKEIIEDVYILRFNKDASFKTSAKNAMKAAIDIQNLITELNFKLNQLKNTLLQCNIAVLKRDIYSPPDSYKSGFNIKLIYTNKNTFKLINSLQTITDAAVYEQVCDDFELSSLSSSFIGNEMVMFFELNLKKYIKIPKPKKTDEDEMREVPKLNVISEKENFEEEENKLYNIDEITFNELKCDFRKTKSIDLMPEVVETFKNKRKHIVSVKSKQELLPGTENFMFQLENAKIFDNIFMVTCNDEMKYQPYGFFHQLLSGIYNFSQSPRCFYKNQFDMFKSIDESGFIKSLVNLEERTYPHPEDIRYSLFDIFLNVFRNMSNVLIYVENFEKIDETSHEILQMIFEKFKELNISFLILSDADFSLHKKSHFLLNTSYYTEVTTRPTPIKEIIGKNISKFQKILDSYYITTVADNTKGSFLYFENAINYLLEKELLTIEDDNTISCANFENIHIPANLDDLMAKRLSHLEKNNKNAYKMLCMSVLTGPLADLHAIKLLNIPDEINALQTLAMKKYIYGYKDVILVQNYNLLRQNILANIDRKELISFTDELLKAAFNMPVKHPCEAFLYNLKKESKKEFIVWEKLSNLSYSMGDFSAYLNCSIKFLKLLDKHVNQSSEKSIEQYKMEIYENISNLLYKYSPNEIYSISKTILENLEKTTNDKKVVNLCNKMLQGCLIGGNYSHALELTRKILSKFSNASINPQDENFNISYFLISLVKIEVLFSIGNLTDCVEAGIEILNVLTPENIQILKPENFSVKQFKNVIFDAMSFVLISKIILLEKDGQLESFLVKLEQNIGDMPDYFNMALVLQEVIRGNKVDYPKNVELEDDKFSGIIFNIIKAFNEHQNDYKAFADAIYQAKVKAKLNKLTQIELVCDLLIGYAHFKLGNIQKAESMYYNILDTSTKNGLKLVKYLDWYFISMLKFEQQEFDVALGIANNAVIQLEKDHNCGDFLFFLLRVLLANIFAAKGENKSVELCLDNANFIKEKYELNLKVEIL